MKKIWMISLSLICFLSSHAQEILWQKTQYAKIAPNGNYRYTNTESNEDWWYDFHNIPPSHPKYGVNAKYVVCGYSTYSEFGSYWDVYEKDPCFDKYGEAEYENNPCELRGPDHQEGVGYIAALGFSNAANNTNEWETFNYGLGSFLQVIPTRNGDFMACGGILNTKVPNNIVYNEPNIPNYLRGQNIEYRDPNNNFCVLEECLPLVDIDNFHYDYGRPCIIRTDKDGRLIWIKYYGLKSSSNIAMAFQCDGRIRDIIEVNDGYVFTGEQVFRDNIGNGNQYQVLKSFVGKIDANGEVLWIKELCGTQNHNSMIGSVICTNISSDNYTLYITGENDINNNGNRYSWLTKMDQNGNCLWQNPLALSDDPTQTNRAKSLSLLINGDIAWAWMSKCNSTINFSPGGHCLSSFVSIIHDNNNTPLEIKRIPYNATTGYDMYPGMMLASTTDGGFLVGSLKRLSFTSWPSIPTNMSGTEFTYYSDCNGINISNGGSGSGTAFYSDAMVSKVKNNGNVEWSTTFDDITTPSPININPLTFQGDFHNPINMSNWVINSNNWSYNIKRQECIYTITTNESGEVVVAGNQSSNLDDCFIGAVNNSCNLYLNDHVIQKLAGNNQAQIGQPGFIPLATFAPDYIGTNIYLGRNTGNNNDIAEFITKDNAEVNITAGKMIKFYPGTKLSESSKIKCSINPLHTCNGGALHNVNDQ